MGVIHDIFDKGIGAPGDDQIDIIIQGQHVVHLGPGLQKPEPAFGQTGPAAGGNDDIGQDAIGAGRLAAAPAALL